MINSTFLKFGDIVYAVEEKNNAFSKKKITTVIDGVEWYRYDRDHWEYSILEIVYCGKITFTATGKVRFDEDRRTELHFEYPDGQIYNVFEDDIEFEEMWFHSKVEAEQYIEELKIERQ